ncbi:MAG: hypothetical protein V3S98_10190, partial [Dehalococcoidia bacterium]
MASVEKENEELNALDQDTIRRISQSLKAGIAVVDPESWSIVFENASFFKWFPPRENGDESLEGRIHGFNVGTAKESITDGRPYTLEAEADASARKAPIAIEVRPLPADPAGLVLIEGHDISKQKQSEYMLESYSDMAEKNARELQR